MTDRLDGKRVLITGAAQGLGAEIARQCSAEGATVIVADIADAPGRALADSLPGPAIYRHLDVTAEADWKAALDAVEADFGALEGLVNNAGVLHMAPIEATALTDLARVLNVNLIGPFLGTRAAIPMLRAARGASIVNVASIDGVASMNSVAAYSASKFGVRGLTKAAALELGRDAIRVNAVCPAMGNPEMVQPFLDQIDVKRYLEHVAPAVLHEGGKPRGTDAGDAARMVVFLLSDDSAGCTGSDFVVDAGYLAGHYCPGLPGF